MQVIPKYYALLMLLLTSCGRLEEKRTPDPNEEGVIPWANNQLLEWKGDSLTGVFYWDTFTNIGPLRYTCFRYSLGDHFFGEHVLFRENETYSEFVERLETARIDRFKNCVECGDSDYWFGTKQNLEIITLYALLKSNAADSAGIYLKEKSKNWRYPSRYSDLYVALLLQTTGRPQIEKALESIADLDNQDSISIENHWLHWQPIGEYNFRLYQDDINWNHYFISTMDRIERDGI